MNMKFLRASLIVVAAALPLLAFAQDTTTQFVPLTSLPGLSDFTSSSDLPAFLNNLYKICIGAAAALAVFQIMRAGFYFMTNKGSVSENEQAKHLLQMSIFGLLLVLSPVIVFGIINPQILSLNFNVDKLKVQEVTVSPENAATTLWENTALPRNEAQAKCEAQGGVASFVCTKDGVGRVVPITEACQPGENGSTVCRTKGGPAGAPGMCSDYTISIASNGVCDNTQGKRQIDRGCCAGLSPTSVCCGVSKSETAAAVSAQVIQSLANTVLTYCEIPTSDEQKSCITLGVTTILNEYKFCIMAAGADGTKIAACNAAAKARGETFAKACIPTITPTQQACAETTIINGLAQAL